MSVRNLPRKLREQLRVEQLFMLESSNLRAMKKKREKEKGGWGRRGRLDIKKSLSKKVEFSNLRAGSTGGSQDQQSSRTDCRART